MVNATIHEMGNGFPGEGDYVPGEGLLWRVVRLEGPIHTGNSMVGETHYVYAQVEEADPDDCDEGDEFPARVVTSASDDDYPPDSEATRRADYELDLAKDESLGR